MKLKPVREQVVVVCGAASGMGWRSALEFARRGAKVVAASRSQEGLDALLAQIREGGGEAIAVATDVRDYAQVKNVARKAVEQYGRLDTWAHFAATSVYAPFRETTPEEFQRVIDVNLLGAAYAAMAALPLLREHGGALIEVSSLEAEVGMPNQSAYTASRHGMRGFMDVLRMELRHERVPVSVTNIMPASAPFFHPAPSAPARKGGPGESGKPSAPVSVYQPETVARAVLHAAEHPLDEVVIGASGGLFLLAKRLAPRLADRLIAQSAYRTQRSGQAETGRERRSRSGTQAARTQGEHEKQLSAASLHTWLQLHPAARHALGGALLAGAAAATALLWRSRRG